MKFHAEIPLPALPFSTVRTQYRDVCSPLPFLPGEILEAWKLTLLTLMAFYAIGMKTLHAVLYRVTPWGDQGSK